jgi:thiol:disulfide interchange protein DsbD
MERPALTARVRALLAGVLAGAALAAVAVPVAAQGRPAAPPVSAVVQTEHVRAELVGHAPGGVVAGRTVRLGLKLAHAPKWHTYWKNAGDSGLPTQLAWTLPAGFTAGEIRWPVPEAIPVGPLVNYGYENEILLAVDVAVPAGFAGPRLDVGLKAEWLVCREICIPEEGTFALALPVGGATVGEAAAFAAADARLPKPAPGATARGTVEADGSALTVVAEGLPPAARGRTLAFFPETPNTIEHAAKVTQSWQDGRWTVRVPLSPQRSESPATMPALVVDAASGSGWPIAVAVRGWPAAAGAAPGVAAAPPGLAPPTVATPPSNSSGASPTLLATLGLALLGGLLLNLMPCVFPVLSIKLLSFAGMSQGRRQRAAGGVAYTVGVVLAFVALGGALIALRAGGEQLGWGFQLQSPPVVAGLAVLFTLLGLNLVGVFEFGNILPSRVACTTLRHPLADDALTGVLAVAIASPCTAPFMGAATGATLAMPAGEALAVFAAIGIGMALPFLVASLVPQVATWLPKPGPWLGRFRTTMAFPMFATVVWLVWVLGRQAGVDSVAVLLLLLLAVAFAAWALGGRGFGRRSRLGFGAVGAALVAIVVSMGWPMLLYPEPGVASVAAPSAAAARAGWRPWSPEALQAARQEGRAVFVDFTAAWCITCQVNKRTTLASEEVLDGFRARDVALLRADWTLRDERITAELATLGRSGVPVYALYPADGGAPRILPEILTVGTVLEALEALPPGAPPTVPAAPSARPPILPASLRTSPTSTPPDAGAATDLRPPSIATSILSRSPP